MILVIRKTFHASVGCILGERGQLWTQNGVAQPSMLSHVYTRLPCLLILTDRHSFRIFVVHLEMIFRGVLRILHSILVDAIRRALVPYLPQDSVNGGGEVKRK